MRAGNFSLIPQILFGDYGADVMTVVAVEAMIPLYLIRSHSDAARTVRFVWRLRGCPKGAVSADIVDAFLFQKAELNY